MHEQRDTTGRSFLLSYIELQKNELQTMQRQLERYAEDFHYLLAASDTRPPTSAPIEWRSVCTNSIEFVDAISSCCMRIARQLGQNERYCQSLFDAAHAILKVQHGARAEHDDRISVLSLEISLFKSKWFNGKGMPSNIKEQDIPLASRIFNLAEYAISLTTPCMADDKHTPLTQSELGELLKPIRGEIFDPQVIDALLQIDAGHSGRAST